MAGARAARPAGSASALASALASTLAVAALAALLTAAPAAAVDIELEAESPLRGEPVAVTVADGGRPVEIELGAESPLRGEPVAVTVTDGGRPVAGARVEAHYRPNSQTASREELAPTGADGRTEWTPRDAGIVTLGVLDPAAPEGGAPLASVNTAVRMGYFPARGIAVMVLAGLLLFGGAAIGMARLLREGRPPIEPPGT